MAKRTRGSHRPGQRRPDRQSPARPQTRPAGPPTSGLSEDEEARAAALESEALDLDRAARSSVSRQAARTRDSFAQRPARGQGLLAAKAAEEYAYVVRDVRHILAVGGIVLAIMAVFFVLVDVARVVTFS
jgi:hypothetical protein